MTIRDEIIDSLAEKCENKLNYYELVNEMTEKIDFRPIVEFVLDCVFGVWEED